MTGEFILLEERDLQSSFGFLTIFQGFADPFPALLVIPILAGLIEDIPVLRRNATSSNHPDSERGASDDLQGEVGL